MFQEKSWTFPEKSCSICLCIYIVTINASAKRHAQIGRFAKGFARKVSGLIKLTSKSKNAKQLRLSN